MKERCFDSAVKDIGAIHAIGNGEIMLYGRGLEWLQALGTPYTCPTVFSLNVPEDVRTRCVTRRRKGAGSWEHSLESGKIIDCASREHRCLARHWQLDKPLSMDMKACGFEMLDQSALFEDMSGVWLINVPGTAPAYNDYPIMTHTYMLVAVRGGCGAEIIDGGLRLTFSGEGDMLVTSAKTWPGAMTDMRAASAVSFEDMLSSADADDEAFLARCAKNRGPVREHPLKARVMEAAEDVALLIRAQQHSGGGVQAGHNYHLAYVRDQYGVSRGLLALGAWDEARGIMEFYREVFSRWGMIANAQAMGVDGIFHVHENDEVEITGYLLLQAADIYAATGDAEFFKSLRPMLDWALNAQLKWLHNNMLPFNGDETYVPGGLLPRTALNHGSFEATLLLVAGGRRYLDLCARLGCEEPWMACVGARLDEVAEAFEESFRRGDIYVTNSLKRLDGLAEPEFRHGVCLGGDAFEWLRRVDEGIYMCPRCAGKKTLPVYRTEVSLKSTLLMETFVRAGQIDGGYIAAQTAEFIAAYRATGRLPSRPDGGICLGYDFGLVLFAAAASALDADDLLCDMLEIRDECGAWVEYYDGKTPQGTRCRPWESGINIAGALEYLKEA